MPVNTNINCDKLVLEGRKSLTMNGVEGVDGFTDSSLKLSVSGNKVYIFGENIKIISFSKENGNLSAIGLFSEIKYSGKKLPLLKKIFK